MIRTLEIRQFGSFRGFSWASISAKGGGRSEFRRLNVLYGRNRSGKTTLSRILRSFETGEIPDKCGDPDFTLGLESGSLTQADVDSQQLLVRVYNRDFVEEHLSFLRDNEAGKIAPFALLGKANKEDEKRITEYEQELGSAESNTGKLGQLISRTAEATGRRSAANGARSALNKRLTNKGREIKNNRTYGSPLYNIRRLEEDIETVRMTNGQRLTDDERSTLVEVTRETELPDITARIGFSPVRSGLLEKASELLSRPIEPTKAIQELLTDALLQAWVREGIPLHRDVRETCGFCGHDLPPGLWPALDDHFNEQASELESEIDSLVVEVDAEASELPTLAPPGREAFYKNLSSRYDGLDKRLQLDRDHYRRDLGEIRNALLARKREIFKTGPVPMPVGEDDAVTKTVNEFNQLIEDHNAATASLADERAEAEKRLRLDEVASFIEATDLEGEQEKIEELEKKAALAEALLGKTQSEVADLRAKIDALRNRQHDESRAAEQVNELLKHHFGHEALRLVAIEDEESQGFRFQITRRGDPAYNLSEGECSLLAFCYFMAKLEEKSVLDQHPIVFIDDPISSLDSNHIFFVFSLIESTLTNAAQEDGTYRCEQLFVSTHNLDFLKYLRRLPEPRKEKDSSGRVIRRGGVAYFLLEDRDGVSSLRAMPDYLREYATEFNYLFHQIYRCRDDANVTEHAEATHNFGNNLRKFLEAYLYFKYPAVGGDHKIRKKLRRFFGDDPLAVAVTNRFMNEASHSAFDRGVQPIDAPEISKIATFVTDKIFEADPDQYNALLSSIGEPPRTA